MTWTETHERYRIIREVVQAAEADTTGALPWREEYAALFGSRDGLVHALRARWQRTCEAQLDNEMTQAEVEETHRRLLAANAGVLRVLDNYLPATGARPGVAEGLSVA